MKQKYLFFASVLALVFVGFTLFSQQKSTVKNVSVQEAATMINSDKSVVVLDVRTREEFASETGHLKNAIQIPVQELESRIGELSKFKGKKIVTYCRSGRRSVTASEILTKNGFDPVNVEGGIIKWNEAKLPVVHEGR